MIDPHNNLPTSFETVDSSLKNIIILDEAEVDYAITNLSALGLQGSWNTYATCRKCSWQWFRLE